MINCVTCDAELEVEADIGDCVKSYPCPHCGIRSVYPKPEEPKVVRSYCDLDKDSVQQFKDMGIWKNMKRMGLVRRT